MTATTAYLDASGGVAGSGAALPRFRGSRTRTIVLVSFTISSYTTGGETLPTAASLDLHSITAVLPVVTSATATAYIPIWDSTNGKLIMNTATGTQAGSTTNIGPVTLLIVGYA